MKSRRLGSAVLSAAAIAVAVMVDAPLACAQDPAAVDEIYFAATLHPVLHAVQCDRCHSDNGVASETRLAFPETDAGEDQITAFGLSLMDLVDRQNPEQSLLLRKPTKRVKHTGGQRIKPGSDEEQALVELDRLPGRPVGRAGAAEPRARSPGPNRRSRRRLTVRRLTHSQYNHTVRDLLGDQIQPAGSFPKEDFVNGFKNQVEGQGVSPLQAEAYGKAAERLARAAFRGGDQRGLIPGQPASPTDADLRGEVRAAVRPQGVPPPADRRARCDRTRELFLQEAGRTQDFHGGRDDGRRGHAPVAAFPVPHRARRGGPNRPVRDRQPPLVFPLGHDARRRAAARPPQRASWRRPSRSRRPRGGCSTIRGPRRRWRSSWRSGCGSTGCWRPRAIAAGSASSTPRSPRRWSRRRGGCSITWSGTIRTSWSSSPPTTPSSIATWPGSTACRARPRNSPRSTIRRIPAAAACWGTAASWC